MSCEDWPCCGHEAGCCPSFDDEGNQLDMVCTCGARLPVNSRSSICRSCIEHADEDEEYRLEFERMDAEMYPEDAPIAEQMEGQSDEW